MPNDKGSTTNDQHGDVERKSYTPPPPPPPPSPPNLPVKPQVQPSTTPSTTQQAPSKKAGE